MNQAHVTVVDDEPEIREESVRTIRRNADLPRQMQPARRPVS